ncbi:MAG: ABC transporter permease [Acidobacteria bacterium]|nr:ABC transporter permease [Acidobacteriota bacterium]
MASTDMVIPNGRVRRFHRVPVLSAFPVFWEALKIALFSIFSNKLRSFLTLIGIIIGVASVVVVGAFISGMELYVTENITSILGSHSFIVAKVAGMNMSREEWERRMRTHRDILGSDYEEVLRKSRLAKAVAVDTGTSASIHLKGKDLWDVRFIGATANIHEISNISVEAGRFFQPFEVERARPVCVVGWNLVNEFFQNVDPIGKTLKVREVEFTIVGVLTKRGSFLGMNMDNLMYIPYTVFQKIFGLRRGLTLRVKTTPENFEDCQEEVRRILRAKRHLAFTRADDFDIMSTDEINQQVEGFAGVVAMVVTPVTLIALLVGGIVIMNIMLVSVTERTREIGIRKAIGARRRDVLLQFLLEAGILGMCGGGLGILGAWTLCAAMTAALGFALSITSGYIILALTVSGGIGILAGLYPAAKASKLDPIRALSYET